VAGQQQQQPLAARHKAALNHHIINWLMQLHKLNAQATSKQAKAATTHPPDD
jgi:hypothetical protein